MSINSGTPDTQHPLVGKKLLVQLQTNLTGETKIMSIETQTQTKPADIMEAATTLNQLQAALTADLATAFDPHSMVKLHIAASNGAQIQLHLLGHEVSEFLNEFIQEKLAKLQLLGVDTTEILANYKEAAEKGLQARNEKTS